MQKLIYPSIHFFVLINKFYSHIQQNKTFTFYSHLKFHISFFYSLYIYYLSILSSFRFIRLSPSSREMEILRYFHLQPDRTLFSCSRPESFPRVSFLCSSHSFVFVSFPFNQVSQVSTRLDRASFTSQTGESTCPKYASREGILPSGCDSKLKITLPR